MDTKTASTVENDASGTLNSTNKWPFADDTATNSTGLNGLLTGNFTDDQMPTTTMANGLNISSTECQNDYCVSDEQYLDMLTDYISPTRFEWCLIVAYFLVFVTGLVGNFLVCFAVWRNHSMRTVTNYFIVNLAVADFLVILVCLPPTLLSDVTETWYMGSVMCKVVKYFQAASVAVSVLTLSAISVERWYAICQPLQFKATPTRAKYTILLTWLVGMVITLPEVIVLDTFPPRHGDLSMLLTTCRPTWPDTYQGAYQCFLIITMYLLPFLLMFVTYFQIAKTLWSNNMPTESSRDCLHPSENTQNVALLHTRRKVAKMLISVVVMFGICYLPVHLLNILRYTGALFSLGELSILFALIAHWLCYFNSAINPVIYNFMSAKFRKEFMTAFICCSRICGSGDPTSERSTQHPQNNRYLYRYHNTAGYQNGRQLHHHWHGPINQRRTVAETYYVTKT